MWFKRLQRLTAQTCLCCLLQYVEDWDNGLFTAQVYRDEMGALRMLMDRLEGKRLIQPLRF